MNWVKIAAVLVLILITGYITYEVSAGVIVPFIIGLVVGGVIAGAVGYWVGVRDAEIKAAEVHRENVNYYTNLIAEAYRDEWEGIMSTMSSVSEAYDPAVSSYYQRVGASLASVYCLNGTPTWDFISEQATEDISNMVESYVSTILTLIWRRLEAGRSLIEKMISAGVTPYYYKFDTPYTEQGYSRYLGLVYVVYRIRDKTWWIGFENDGYISSQHDEYDIIVPWSSNNEIRIVVEVGTTRYVLGKVVPGSGTYVDQEAVKAFVKNTVDLTVGWLDVYNNATGQRQWVVTTVFPPLWNVPRIVRNMKVEYEYYCPIVNRYGPQMPPPHVYLPLDPKELEKIPPEMRLVIYLAILEKLKNTDWSQVNVSVTVDNVEIAGGVWITGSIKGVQQRLMPINIPFNVTFIKGKPGPLVGSWFTGKEVRFYGVSPLSSDMSYEPIDGTPYSWVYRGGQRIGLGIDGTGDGVPDIYSPEYFESVEKIEEWDPVSRKFVERDVVQVGRMTLREWFRYNGIDVRDEDKDKKNIFDNLKDNKLILIAAAGGALLLILLVLLASKDKVIVAR